MNDQYAIEIVNTILSTTAWAIGLWVVLFVVVAETRGKIDEHTWSVPLWSSIIMWIIVFFMREWY